MVNLNRFLDLVRGPPVVTKSFFLTHYNYTSLKLILLIINTIRNIEVNFQIKINKIPNYTAIKRFDWCVQTRFD